MKIITGYRGEPHVTSQQQRYMNISLYGDGVYIIKDIGLLLSATVVSSNLVEINSGMLIAQGCTACIERGQKDSLAIENGSQGMQRIDLIVARYTLNLSTGIEDMQLAVIKGTPSATDPETPSYNRGTIYTGDPVVEFPLYKVFISGISITGTERLVGLKSVDGEFGTLDTRLYNAEANVDAIWDDLKTVKRKSIEMKVNIPDGSTTPKETTISLAQYVPPTGNIVGIDVTLGDFHMPYVTAAGAIGTWISRARSRQIVINNRVGAYTNYTMKAVVFYTEQEI